MPLTLPGAVPTLQNVAEMHATPNLAAHASRDDANANSATPLHLPHLGPELASSKKAVSDSESREQKVLALVRQFSSRSARSTDGLNPCAALPGSRLDPNGDNFEAHARCQALLLMLTEYAKARSLRIARVASTDPNAHVLHWNDVCYDAKIGKENRRVSDAEITNRRNRAHGTGGADYFPGIDCFKESTEMYDANCFSHSDSSSIATSVDSLNDSNRDNVDRIHVVDSAEQWAEPRKSATNLSDAESLKAMAVDRNLPDLDDSVIRQPYHYLRSLPSKGIRDQAIDALNKWLAVPARSTARIKSIIQMLHGASLMLDDMQDGSPLRRGQPSTHSIYGMAQTINSATYQYIQATTVASQLCNPACLRISLDEMQQLHVGQSYDLHWMETTRCPSVPEYLRMVDKKTGGMFCLLTRLMLAESPTRTHITEADLSRFSCLIGRFFQIRDDYQNLTSADYAQQKGFAEDLDKGKYSFTLIHCIQTLASHGTFAPDAMHLNALLMKRRVEGKLSIEMKREIFALMNKTKSLDRTLSLLRRLFGELEREVGILEESFGRENPSLRVMLEMMKV